MEISNKTDTIYFFNISSCRVPHENEANNFVARLFLTHCVSTNSSHTTPNATLHITHIATDIGQTLTYILLICETKKFKALFDVITAHWTENGVDIM